MDKIGQKSQKKKKLFELFFVPKYLSDVPENFIWFTVKRESPISTTPLCLVVLAHFLEISDPC